MLRLASARVVKPSERAYVVVNGEQVRFDAMHAQPSMRCSADRPGTDPRCLRVATKRLKRRSNERRVVGQQICLRLREGAQMGCLRGQEQL